MSCNRNCQGDSLIPEISAASILAKTARDAEMLALHERFPHYGFDRHKGYSTEQHITAIRIHGISEVHRRSFAPVRESLANFGVRLSRSFRALAPARASRFPSVVRVMEGADEYALAKSPIRGAWNCWDGKIMPLQPHGTAGTAKSERN